MTYLITLIPEISGVAGTWKEKLISENDFCCCLFLAWAWLVKPKVNVVIPKNQTSPKYLRKKRVKVRSTTCHYAIKKRPVKIAMYLGLDIIIKLKFTTDFDRCAI